MRATADPYLLGNSPAEVEHLVSQAEVYAVEAGELLDRLGPLEGAHVADIGCGVLGVLHLLRERVGPRGQVVGVDRDRALLDYAAKLATTRGIGIELVEADATDMSSIATDSFDLVHERTVLLNVTQPAEVIAEMTRVARPGGIVAIQEPDAAAWVCDPPHRAWDLLRDALVGAYAESGKQFNAGRTVARWLRDAGLTDVQVRVTARATAPGEYYHTFLLALCGLVRGQIIELGRMTPADFDGTIAELADHLAGPGTITCQPTMWQAWGRKPLA